MREYSKENSPLNAQRSLSSKEEAKTKYRSFLLSDENIFEDERSLLFEKKVQTKHKLKRDACNNTPLLFKRSFGRLENANENKGLAEVVSPRITRKKSHLFIEQMIDLTEDLSDDSTEESPSIDSPFPLPVGKESLKQKSPDFESTSCKYCGETKDKITECSVPLKGASKEKDMLNFHEIQSSEKISDDLPCVKLLGFRVYDKARHLCPFDGELIKAQDGLYFSGFVKPFDSEETDLSDSLPCEDIGPITDWWFTGFDPNDESNVGFSTKMANYYLETPMAEYAPFMTSVEEKIFLAKIVIDILENVSDDENLSYESLLDILKRQVPSKCIPTITEEILLKNGVFVCQQIRSYDAAADENEKLLGLMPCMEELSRKVNYNLGAESDEDADDDDSNISICRASEHEQTVIDFIDLDKIDSSDDDGNGVKRARRRCRKFYEDFDWSYEDDEEEEEECGRKSSEDSDDQDDYVDDDAKEKCQRKPRQRKQYHKGPKEPMRRKSPARRVMMPIKTIKLSKATTTSLVEDIFIRFFSGEIMRNYTRNYSDTSPGLMTNSLYNITRSYDDYNLMIPTICLTKLEDMDIHWGEGNRIACEKMETENAQATVNEPKRKPKDSQVLENDIVPEAMEEKMDSLSINLPVIREFKCIELKLLDPDVVEFYVNKNNRCRKNDIINMDSSLSESDLEPSSKRRKMSEKPENLDIGGYTVPELRQILEMRKTQRRCSAKIMWINQPYKTVEGYKYYEKIQINDSKVSVGDFISMYNSNSIGCIKYLFENVDREQLFHIHWFTRSMDTILAEVGHPNEIFESNQCEDVPVKKFYQVVSVKFIPTGADWFKTGNMTYVNQLNKNEDPSQFLYYQKRFCEKTARFTNAEPESSCSFVDCNNCERLRRLVQREIPYSEEKSIFDKERKMFALKMVRWRDEEFHVGSCVFLTPGSIMKLESKKNEENNDDDEDYDEDLYPEKYRKRKHVRSVQDEDVLSDPFEIGYICAIWSKKQEISKSADVKLKLRKFYRPHNTSLSQDEIRKLDLNLLYWSDEECTVDFPKVQGKCYVSYKKNLSCSVEEWTQKGPYRFYFTRAYDSKLNVFESLSPSAMRVGNFERGDEEDHVEIPKEYPSVSRPLHSLDVFAGCGGLTEGLHQAKVAKCKWAIEKDVAAAKAFKLNYPDAAVFTDDCNFILNAAINRQEKVWAGKELPQKGDVEMICGGPPCQGFSGMNRFSYGQWSKFNNSLVVTFLSYCDYYRPRFFVMENVRNFATHQKSVVLKLTLNCLVKMGYQVAFGVLQSGRYGIPQSRRRVIILAAAPGETLPVHPEATHTFPLLGFEAVSVDDSKYVTSAQWTNAAPYRMITVYDALSDLPPIKAGDSKVEKPYCRKPITHFQRQLRTYNGEGDEETVLRDHICKSLNALVVKRLSFIPKRHDCDWRDLPNIVVKLSDGTMTKKLKYTHHDAKQGKASNGSLRGVCCCANGGKCRPEFRQSNTIIPWCLPHTSNRNGHWRGLYGRLGWNEYFRTVVTNPEPMGKQGRVVHPEENRVLSVKECARSQGFPDRFKFYGDILNKHRQIGNAVAPPLAKAIGLEIKKCIHEKESKC